MALFDDFDSVSASSRRFATPQRGPLLACVAAVALAVAALPALAAKDSAPAGKCDAHAAGSAAWTACATEAAALSDAELFYAGYWMARIGRYVEAIDYLGRARTPDARTLTYLGFATRKSGDVAGAFVHYRQALAIDPDFVVARAYMGEAHLAVGDVAGAKGQLAEIARRCGTTCAAFDDLARNIAKFTG